MNVTELIEKLKDFHPDQEILVSVPTEFDGFKFVSIEDIDYCKTDQNEELLVIFPYDSLEDINHN